VLGKTAEVDDQPGIDAWKDAVVDQSGPESHKAGEYAEPAAVTHLQKLVHGQGPCLAVTIQNPAGHGQDEDQRPLGYFPPQPGETAVGVHLPESHDSDRAEFRPARGNADQVSPAAAVGHEEIADPTDVAPGELGGEDEKGNQSQNDRPVNPVQVHRGTSGRPVESRIGVRDASYTG